MLVISSPPLLLHAAVFLTWAWSSLAFGAAAILTIRAVAKRESVWGGALSGVVAADIALIFLAQSVDSLGLFSPLDAASRMHRVAHDALELMVPALLAHLFYSAGRTRQPHTAWKAGVVAAYFICAGCAVATLIVPLLAADRMDLRGYARPAAATALGAAGLFIAIMVTCDRTTGTIPSQRLFYRWLIPTLGLIILLQAAELVVRMPPAVQIVHALLPGCLLFVLTYYLQPLTFDVLVKEVTFYFFLLAALYSAWWVVPAIAAPLQPAAFGVLILAVSVILSASPLFHRVWVRWVDRKVFGRPFAPEDARMRFLASLEGAITEKDLVPLAEAALGEIFGSSACICLPDATSPESGLDMRVAIKIAGQDCGSIVIASRRHRMQFLGEDQRLLRSLGAELSIMLDNLRLRETTLAEERRATGLQLLATRAQIQTLRAQINPHFLFNSLSAVAGLIGKDAERARETVEQLAEVFRYVLYRSGTEWVRVAEEVEFVTSYLNVERARFGPRLRAMIKIEKSAADALIPAMALQVLVENAVKHGISAIPGPGIVSVRAECSGGRLRIEVRDNGPGFNHRAASGERGTGLGLRNVQDRLRLYFDDATALRTGREGSMTVVTLEMPAAVSPFTVPVPQ